MSSLFYDRQGNPLPHETGEDYRHLEELLEMDKHVAEDTLPDGKWISTVWLGIDHSFMGGPPLIFETMVFPVKGEWDDLDCQRYSTEAEALEGHRQMVAKWTTGGQS